jgi:cysteine desulfurase
MNIDLMSISGHKLYGPKGIGALYVRRRPRVRLQPLFSGGGQERGIRSGTLPTPLCVGLGEACAIAGAEMTSEAERLKRLAQRLYAALARGVPGLTLNGDAERRIPGNLSLRFPGVPADALIAAVPEVSVSTGSACTSAAVEPSYVLQAIGMAPEGAAETVRIGLGRFTTETEVDFAAERLIAAARRIHGQASAA